jgi:ribosomal protein S18 acetylase RimI-like enzyme
LEAKLNNTECNLLFARLKGEVVGTIGFEADPEAKNQAEIWGFYVKSNLQGQGIGRKLWLRLMDKIKLMNFDKLTLTVAKDTPNSLRFYEKNGFKLSGEIEKDWPSWTKEHLLNQYWLMQKDI